MHMQQQARVVVFVCSSLMYISIPIQMAQQVPLLHTCSLTLAPGAMAAIVGARGCGKTALAELLQRLYDVDAGTVLLDGHDVRSLDRCHI